MSSISQFGFPALFQELSAQGISEAEVLGHASIDPDAGRLNQQQRIDLFRAAAELSVKPETGLLAGARQNIGNYGAYGYALASSRNMRSVFDVYANFISMTGAVFRISWKIEDGVGVLWSHEPHGLGEVLPFVAEYWRASQTRILSSVLGRSFPSIAMQFPYPKPGYAELYPEILNCPATFGSEALEWHFEASVLDEPCAAAVPDVAKLHTDYCELLIQQNGGLSGIQQEVMRFSLPYLEDGVDAATIAAKFNMSLRTFYRRLEAEGASFQSLIDRLRRSVAVEYLRFTQLSVEQIAERCGYDDVSNFRKAFKRWTGHTPSAFRKAK